MNDKGGGIKKRVSISFTEEEYYRVETDATRKGLKTSQYCKMAVFAHLNKYGYKITPGPTDVGSESD